MTFFVVFCLFLRSWRPGKPFKSFLEAIRFDSTVCEPVATLKTSNRLIFYVFRPPFRPADSSFPTCFVAKRFFDEGSDPPRPIPQDPHRNPHKTTCLPAPHLVSNLQWWLERSEQRATEDMTSVGTEDMSSVAEGRVMLENQIVFQETKNHGKEIREE